MTDSSLVIPPLLPTTLHPDDPPMAASAVISASRSRATGFEGAWHVPSGTIKSRWFNLHLPFRGGTKRS